MPAQALARQCCSASSPPQPGYFPKLVPLTSFFIHYYNSTRNHLCRETTVPVVLVLVAMLTVQRGETAGIRFVVNIPRTHDCPVPAAHAWTSLPDLLTA